MQLIRPPQSGKIIFDCDEVLLPYHPNFRAFLKKVHGIETNGPAPTQYNMGDWMGISDLSQIFELIHEFNNSPTSGFDQLVPKPEAVAKVRELKDAGYDLHVLTMASEDPETGLRRIGNLERGFGVGTFTDVICIGLMDSKLEHLKKHDPSIFIDDVPKNVLMGEEAGHHSLLMKSSHNEAFIHAGANGMPVLHQWDDFNINHDYRHDEIGLSA
ncbi:MAG: hypothetical protein ABJN42_19925 [Roseibium sp.]|uniref:hypothetical protein n=1 Tax=Roseibium sp. TaxID=1936156 RepID=UPI003297D47D